MLYIIKLVFEMVNAKFLRIVYGNALKRLKLLDNGGVPHVKLKPGLCIGKWEWGGISHSFSPLHAERLTVLPTLQNHLLFLFGSTGDGVGLLWWRFQSSFTILWKITPVGSWDHNDAVIKSFWVAIVDSFLVCSTFFLDFIFI